MLNIDKHFDDFCDYLHENELQVFDEICKIANGDIHFLKDFLKRFISKYEEFVDKIENKEHIEYLCEHYAM